jgi:hypothetical protein
VVVEGWQEGQDGQVAAYRERLWPGPGLLILTAIIIAPVAIAYGAVLGAWLGWSLGVLLIALAWAWLIGSAPALRVDERVFRAGRARLPRPYVGVVRGLTAEELAHERTRGDVRTYFVIRPGTSRTAVLIENVDPDDPHPRWVVQTRRPAQLVAALSRPQDTATA